ncbi:t-SNARE [Metschnikowia bicuspidata]|uniref:t-SNARE n=1 Tax=Metschnikowia bicuspidata TaxID=27322 RepID=A0A4V1J331_9ASCO|nr:t-SNARE [Metschnikowia bicuspidata]
MSFANYDYEAQSPRVKDEGSSVNAESAEVDLDSAIRKTSVQLEKYGVLIADFNTQMKLVGGRRDTLALRNKIDALQQEISALGTAIKTLIGRINTVMSKSNMQNGKFEVSNRHLMMKDRLVSDFNGLNGRFQLSVKSYQERKLACAPKSPPPSANERTPLVKNQPGTQLQLHMTEDEIQQTELQYHLLLTEERNRQINEVAEGIREVNSIFKDLGELVTQQGEQLDTVEENILQMQGNTQQASRELTKAHEYQKRKSKWGCILLVALFILVLIMVLAVLN